MSIIDHYKSDCSHLPQFLSRLRFVQFLMCLGLRPDWAATQERSHFLSYQKCLSSIHTALRCHNGHHSDHLSAWYPTEALLYGSMSISSSGLLLWFILAQNKVQHHQLRKSVVSWCSPQSQFQLHLKSLLLSHGWSIVYVKSKKAFCVAFCKHWEGFIDHPCKQASMDNTTASDS